MDVLRAARKQCSTCSVPDEALRYECAWALTADGTLATETTVPDFQGSGAPITMKATYKKK